MRKIIIYVVISTILFNVLHLKAQTNKETIDSLLNVINRLSSPSVEIKLVEGADTALINTLNLLTRKYLENSDNKQAEKYGNDALNKALKTNYNNGIATAYSNMGIFHLHTGNYNDALDFFLKGLRIWEQIGDLKKIASCHGNIGNIYFYYGNYKKALRYYLSTLKIQETIKDEKGIANSLNNVGNVYYYMNDYEKAREYYYNSLKKRKLLGDKKAIAASYNNIGNTYEKQKNYQEALKNNFQSLAISEKEGHKKGMASSYNNIATLYYNLNDLDKSLNYLTKSLKIEEEIGNKEGIATSYVNIGALYLKQNNYKEAHHFLNQALDLSNKIKSSFNLKLTYHYLSELHQKQKKFEKAFEYHQLYANIKDSLLNEESSKQIAEMNSKYESEKKEKDIQLLTKDKRLQETEIGKQKLVKNIFIIGFAIAILIAVIVLRLFKATKKQKLIIEHQNQQIVESINYSKRIQHSLLPSIADIKQAIPNVFVFYEPKNIVSGDFYYFKQFESYSVLACVDCTGHG
ncbi:MAG: tetratricopeptide repeat protein, partial [Bacteroidia bacterium]